MASQPSLWKRDTFCTTATEGIKYAGSKAKIIPYILRLAQQINATSVFDGFSGTTRVSQAFANAGYRVVSNDLAVWSEIFGTCYLLAGNTEQKYRDLIDHLNAVPPVYGWFTENYGGYSNGGCSVQRDGLKKPWQVHNTQKLDGIRQEIENLNLCKTDKSVALTSLILALDRVDNTLGHFVSYLKNWSPRSYDTLTLKVPNICQFGEIHSVHSGDTLDMATQISTDIAYFDPPYGSGNEKMPPSRVRYAAYYHIWTSICLFDKPQLFGKAGRRIDSSDAMAYSPFEEFRKNHHGRYIATESIDILLKKTQAQWVILSYSSGGRATAEDLNDIIHSNGKLLEVVEIDHKKNVMSSMAWTNKWINDAGAPNKEFLFLVEKT